jgi:broad specificity phosphatase PhoE
MLYLVRHGQAAFLTDNYDRLSDLGKRQGACLGSWWAEQGLALDAVFSGPGERHKDTARAAATAIAECGGSLPDFEIHDGLHEFTWEALMRAGTSAAGEGDEELAPLAAGLAAAEGYREKHRAVQHFMEALTVRWVRGEIDGEDLESWAHFHARVNAAIEHMTRETAQGARIAAFTSGGPIALAMQRALELRPEKTLELIWTLRNGAVVEFLFSGDRFSLGSFNSAPHLPTADLWTYR